MDIADDSDDNCVQWASDGECTNNPNFIQLRCPVACGQAVGWSIWARRAVGISEPLPFHDYYIQHIERCPNTVDISGIADNMLDRLNAYISGGERMIKGLSSTAPSEYLGMYGLTEAVIYTIRLYEIVFMTLAKKNDFISEFLSDHRKLLSQVLDIVGHQYSSDILMRNLPKWIDILDGTSAFAHKALASKSVDSINDYCNIPISPKILDILSIDAYNNDGYYDNIVSPYVTLSNDIEMPSIGLGTWQLNGADCEIAVENAIKIGYRHIDTAEAYGNEMDVGWAVYHMIEENIITREDIFIATKISNEENGGYTNMKRLFERQLEQLKTDYIDLYMLHSPMSDKSKQISTWKALEELYSNGKIRALGVSNFNSRDLEDFLPYITIKPMVIQNKVDVYHIGKQLDNQGDDIIGYADSNNIKIVGYSSFSAYPFVMVPLEDPIVKYIANKNKITPGQVILRWLLQHNISVIPRSSNIDRLLENFQALTILSLDHNDMKLLDSLQFLVESPVAKAVPISI
eukprot:gene20690-26823_t